MSNPVRHFLFLMTAALLLLACTSVWAQDSASMQSPPVQPHVEKFPALADFARTGGTIAPLGRTGSLEGFALVTADGALKTIYITPDETMLMGILVDAQGKNLTAQQLSAYRQRLDGDQSPLPGAAEGSASKAEYVYAATEKTAWVGVGPAGAPYIYVFMNINCDHCQAMFKDLAPLIARGALQVRLVPFGSVAANRDGGAALLSVSDPGAAWLAYINGDVAALGKDKISAGALEKVAANTRFITESKIKGTPFTLYRRPADGVVTAIAGRPKNVLTLAADLLPLPPAPTQPAAPGVGP